MNSKDVDRKLIWLFAKEYLSSSYVSFECVGAHHGISGRMVANILWRGIAENILSTAISEAIYSKVIHSSYRGHKHQANRWDNAFDERQKIRKELSKKLSMLKELEKLLSARIEHYNEYVASTTSPVPLETLNEKLKQARELITRYNAALC